MAETEKKTIILDFEVDEKDAIVSIEKLTAANKALREERKKVDLSTEEGIKRVKDINAQIEANTKTITSNSTTLEKNRANVGNYTESINKSKVGQADFNKTMTEGAPALDAVTGGLASAANGVWNFIKASVAFIATPIGAVLAALGVAIGAVIAYFKSSEEAENKLTKVTAVLGAVFEQLMNFVEALGENIVKVFEDPQKAGAEFVEWLKNNLINRFEGLLELIPAIGKSIQLVFKGQFAEAGEVAGNALIKVTAGVENGITKIKEFANEVKVAVEEGVKNGKILADVQAKLDADERKLIVARAKTALEVAKLRERALKEEGEVKKATIMEAIKLEQNLSAIEVKHAQDKLKQAIVERDNNGDTIEAKKKVAEAEAGVINAEAQRYEATLRFQKQFEALDDAEAKRKEKLRADEEAANKKADEARKKRSDQAAKDTKAWFDAKFKAEMDAIELEEKAAAESVAIQKKKQEDILAGVNASLAVASSLTSQFGEAQQNQFKLEEQALAVSLANKNQLLNDQYVADIKALDDKLANNEISQEEYDEAILGLNGKLKADQKAAEIEQAKELNEIKRKEFEANKKNQIANAVIQVAQAALAAFSALAGIPIVGPILAAIAAGAAIAFGAVQINQIKQSEFVPATFKTGGWTGDGDPNELAGLTHKREFVMPADVVARYGKEHFQSYMDGSVVANAATAGVGGGASQQKIVVYASWTEFKRFETEMEMKESVTTA